jgi:hypothetical protein
MCVLTNPSTIVNPKVRGALRGDQEWNIISHDVIVHFLMNKE